jgi:hypothetical protein
MRIGASQVHYHSEVVEILPAEERLFTANANFECMLGPQNDEVRSTVAVEVVAQDAQDNG